VIRIIYQIVFAISGISAILILYDYYETHQFISKQQAIDIALDGFHCKRLFNFTGTSAELIHAVNKTQLYNVDERNMQDMALAFESHNKPFEENQYLWKVVGSCYQAKTGEEYGFEHFVNAKTGKLLE
jgi:hypothetical protein